MNREPSTVSSRGRVVIPASLRRKYSIRKGTKIAFFEENDRLILQPINNDFVQRIRSR